MVDAARLRRTNDIAAVRAHGRVRSDRLVTVRALDTDLGRIRVAVSSMREAGGAVARNRARRRVSEAVRADLRERASAPSIDLLIAARAAARSAPWTELRAGIHRLLDVVLAPR